MERARRAAGILGWCLAAVLCAPLAACSNAGNGQARPLPGGTYSSTAYHFSVTYPSGWALSANGCTGGTGGGTTCDQLLGTATVGAGQAAAAVPLQITITRAGQASAVSPGGSSFAVAVLDLRDPNVAKAAARLAADPALHKATLANLPAYASAPMPLSLPGANGTPSARTDTHTDYYVVHSDYEYQITVDAVSGDGAEGALQQMLSSFALTA
jgi:hypothetical protein